MAICLIAVLRCAFSLLAILFRWRYTTIRKINAHNLPANSIPDISFAWYPFFLLSFLLGFFFKFILYSCFCFFIILNIIHRIIQLFWTIALYSIFKFTLAWSVFIKTPVVFANWSRSPTCSNAYAAVGISFGLCRNSFRHKPAVPAFLS